MHRGPQLERASRLNARKSMSLGSRVRKSMILDRPASDAGSQPIIAQGGPDPLALVRRTPASLRSILHIKAGIGVLNLGWDRYWGELRGNLVALFDAEAQHWTGSDSEPSMNYIFSVLGCIVARKKGNIIKIRRTDSPVPVFVRFATEAECERWFLVLAKLSAQRTVTIADFEFVAPVGKGASGKVFLVKDRKTGSKYALKIIEKRKVFEHKSAFRHAVDERAALELVRDHPFFIQLRFAFQSKTSFFLVTDFYEGGDLFQYLKSNGCLHERESRQLMAELVLALEYLHAKNVVYRDLKPENILLDEGHIRIADFGLCKKLTKAKFNGLTSTICGTFTYAAPEMLAVKHYGLSVDLWTLGIFVYHVLRGKTPFEAKDLEQVIHNMNNNPIQFPPGLSKHCTALIKGLLEWRPENRLGCGPGGISELKSHPFFEGMDFEAVYKRKPNRDLLFESQTNAKGTTGELRNFDMTEWRDVSFDKEGEEMETADITLWPPVKAAEVPSEDFYLAGYLMGSA